ncbi:MAG: VanW family protein [Acidimicrobiia bacterium]
MGVFAAAEYRVRGRAFGSLPDDMGSAAAPSRPVIRASSTSGPRVLRGAAFALGGVLLVAFFLAVLERVVYSGDVMPGVRVDGVDVEGKSEDAAFTEISALAADLETQPLRATLGDRELVANASILEMDVDELATLERARRAGRSGNPIEQTLGTVLRRVRTEEVPLVVDYSQPGLDGLLDGWQREAANGGVEGNLQFEGTIVIPVEPVGGTGLLRKEAEALVARELASPARDSITLPVGDVEPSISKAEVERAAAEARVLLTGNHDLLMNGLTLSITPEQLATALATRVDGRRLALVINPDQLRTTLGAALAAVEQAPADASFQVTAANTVEVVPSATGRQVDLVSVADEILAGNRSINAPVIETPPARDTAWAQSLGIKEQVSTFTTRHNSGEERVKNIHRGADLLNNTVVEPGATFSLNDTLGPRTAERGFVVAPVFYGEFTEDVGGGVSQLATTTFNAVFWGGYEDVYHKPHTIYISRYPMGREATVNYPSVDLKFRNDSSTGVLIRTSYSANSITVTFYGDKEGKVVREEGRRVLAEYPIEEQPYECPGPSGLDKGNLCAGLAAGARRLAEAGHGGIDVEFFRVIERPGEEPARERFFWRYKMFPNKYLVGTGPPPTAPPPTTVAPPTPPPAPITPAPPVTAAPTPPVPTP